MRAQALQPGKLPQPWPCSLHQHHCNWNAGVPDACLHKRPRQSSGSESEAMTYLESQKYEVVEGSIPEHLPSLPLAGYSHLPGLWGSGTRLPVIAHCPTLDVSMWKLFIY